MNVRPLFAVVTLAALLGLAAGCSSDDSGTAGSDATGSTTQTTTGDVQQVPPIMADAATLDGTTQQVPLDNVFVLTGDTAPVDAWTATVEPQGVVEFTPGRSDGSATYNPGLKPLAEGTATVTLQNSETGASITFTVEVTAAAK